MKRGLVLAVGLAVLAVGCGGDRFDRDAASAVVDDERVVEAAQTLCDDLDDLEYQFALAMAIDDGEDELVDAMLAGCPKKP